MTGKMDIDQVAGVTVSSKPPESIDNAGLRGRGIDKSPDIGEAIGTEHLHNWRDIHISMYYRP